MDVKEAISRAKSYVNEIFAEEGLKNLGLEEVRYDDGRDLWLITVGFSRPWDAAKPLVTAIGRDLDLKRTYKVVQIKSDDGQIVSVTDRRVES